MQGDKRSTKNNKPLPPSRNGRIMLAGYFNPEVHIALKVIAAEERTTLQALLTEGINAVLTKRRRPKISELAPQ